MIPEIDSNERETATCRLTRTGSTSLSTGVGWSCCLLSRLTGSMRTMSGFRGLRLVGRCLGRRVMGCVSFGWGTSRLGGIWCSWGCFRLIVLLGMFAGLILPMRGCWMSGRGRGRVRLRLLSWLMMGGLFLARRCLPVVLWLLVRLCG